jgi:hypothetical protein
VTTKKSIDFFSNRFQRRVVIVVRRNCVTKKNCRVTTKKSIEFISEHDIFAGDDDTSVKLVNASGTSAMGVMCVTRSVTPKPDADNPLMVWRDHLSTFWSSIRVRQLPRAALRLDSC